jgi:hypothetical protein
MDNTDSFRSLVLTLLASTLLLAGCGAVQVAAVNHDIHAIKTQAVAASDQCNAGLGSPALDPIREKVERFRRATDGAPPFTISSNDTFPTEAERAVIAQWATIRDGCLKRSEALLVVPASARGNQSTLLQQQFFGIKDVDASEQFANTLAAWSVYMQAVNARQPQTVYLNGTIQVVR